MSDGDYMMLCEPGQMQGPHFRVFGYHQPHTAAMESTVDTALGAQAEHDQSTQAEDEVTHSHIGIIFAQSAAVHESNIIDYFTRRRKQTQRFQCASFMSQDGDYKKTLLQKMTSCKCLYITVDEEFSQILDDNYSTFKTMFKELTTAKMDIYLIDYLDDCEALNEVRYKLPREFRNNLVPKEKFNKLTVGPVTINENDHMAVQVGENNQIEFDRSGGFQSSQIGGNSVFNYRSDPSVTGYVLTIKTPELNHQLDVSIKRHIDDNRDSINVNLRDLHARLGDTRLGSVIIEVSMDKGAKIGPDWLRELITRILSEDIFAMIPQGTRMELVIRASIPLKPLDVNIFATDAVPIIPSRYPLQLSPEQIQYLKESPPAKQFLLKRLESEGITCEFDFDHNSIGILEQDDSSEPRAQQILKDGVFVQDMSKQTNNEDVVSTNGSNELRPRIVKVGNETKLVGIADAITFRGGHTDSGVSVFDEEEKVISVDEKCLKYFLKYKWTELTASVQKYHGVTITAGDKYIKLQGPLFAVGRAAKMIKDEMTRVNTFEINLGPEINLAVVAKVAEEVGQRNNCAITYKQHLGTESESMSLESNPQSFSLRVSGRKDTKIKVVMNDLERQKAHVIVNTTNTTLDLNQGKGVTSSIFKAAGSDIQTELKKTHPKGIQHGEVAESRPGNMKTCRTIYHVALPQFPKDKGSKDYNVKEGECFKWLVSLVFNCLIKASSSEQGYRTIAFPALGTGFLEYPVQHVVKLMYKAIRLYNDDERSGTIREVIVVIHPDTQLIVKQLFLAHRQTHQLKSCHVATIGQIQDGKTERAEIRVLAGSTLVQVVNGNIQKACEVSEAVQVFWTDKDILNPETNPGLISTPPTKTDWKCSAYVSELADSKCAADSTSLPGITLVHSYCKNDTEMSYTAALSRGIENASKVNCNTLTLPFGSLGHMTKTHEAAARVIINAVTKTKTKTKIFVVTVVIPDHDVFVSFATKVAAQFDNKLQQPADDDKSTVAVDLWEEKFAGKALASTTTLHSLMTMSSVDSALLITSDSEDKNKMVAQELKSKLASRLSVKLEST